MTNPAQRPNFFSKKFVKILPQGFWPGLKVNTTLTKKAKPLQTNYYSSLSTVDTP